MFFSYLHKPLEQVLNNNRSGSFVFINIYYFIFNKVCSKTPKELIQESIANYPGKCPCPYSIKSNGKNVVKIVHILNLLDMNHFVIFQILQILKMLI